MKQTKKKINKTRKKHNKKQIVERMDERFWVMGRRTASSILFLGDYSIQNGYVAKVVKKDKTDNYDKLHKILIRIDPYEQKTYKSTIQIFEKIN